MRIQFEVRPELLPVLANQVLRENVDELIFRRGLRVDSHPTVSFKLPKKDAKVCLRQTKKWLESLSDATGMIANIKEIEDLD